MTLFLFYFSGGKENVTTHNATPKKHGKLDETASFFINSVSNRGHTNDIYCVQARKNQTNEEHLEKNDSSVFYISDIETFCNGTATIKFEMDDMKYSGVINSKGEVVYYSEGDHINWTSVGNGAGFVTNHTDGKKSYILINDDKQKTITADDNAFDSILGYGDGLILVYKNTSGISNEEHSYGVLDCNGNWVKPLTAGIELPVPDSSSWEPYTYIGEGSFISYHPNYVSSYGAYILYNSDTNCAYFINACSIFDDGCPDGVVYGKYTGRGFLRGFINDYPDQTERLDLPAYFALHANGTFEEISEFSSVYNNLLININGEYMQIFDKENNFNNQYDSFLANRISSVEFDEDHGLVILDGADGNTYFTVIDKACAQKFDPIACQSATISDNRIVYKNSDNIYEVVDPNGNTVVSKTQGYTYIGSFDSGFAKAENSSGQCYIGIDGTPLTIKLSK